MIELTSEDNIKQAWNKIKNWALYPRGEKWVPRVTDSIDIFHKRQVLEFNLNEEKRLEFITKKIQCKTYEPSKGDIYYLPKSNYGLRPMVVLSCDDLIYYQSIINVLVELFSDEFTSLSDRFIYGHIPLPYNSDLIIKPYRNQHKLFIKQIKNKQDDNFIIGETDITSFYEEISFDLLKTILKTKFDSCDITNYEVIDNLIYALGVWLTPSKNLTNKSKGIPQGIPQSHILANIFLFPLDQKLKGEVDYIRYVDDFRIFASSELAISYGFLFLDECLREMGLLKKDSKTSISNKYEHDPFENFYAEIRDNSKTSKKDAPKKNDIQTFFSFNISPGILDVVDFEELDIEELDTEEKIQNEIFSKIQRQKKDEDYHSSEENKESAFFELNNIKSTHQDVLLEICEKYLVIALQNIFTDEELQIKYPRLFEYKAIKSVKTINYNPLLLEQYSSLLNHIFKTVLVIKAKQINNSLCSNFTNYIALQNCINNPWEICLYSRYFQFVLKYQKIGKNTLDSLLNWLEKQLDSKNPFDTIKYYAFAILSSDLTNKKKSALSENSLFYIKNDKVSWYLKVKAYETYLAINKLSANPTVVQSSLSHFKDPNNSCSSKLVLAHEIENFHKISRLINVSDDVRNQEIKTLIELTSVDQNPTLNYCCYRLLSYYENNIVLKNKAKYFKEFSGELSYDCFIRAKLENIFKIHFPADFSITKIIEKNKYSALQPDVEMLNKLILLTIHSKNDKKWEVYINAVIAVIEGLLFTLYSRLGLIDDKKNIKGFGYHKRVLNKLFKSDQFDWDELIDNIGQIRNKNLLSHIRDIKTSEFNPVVDDETLNYFEKLSKQMIQNVIDLFSLDIPKEKIKEQNDDLAKARKNYEEYYYEVITKLPIVKNKLSEIDTELDSIDM